MPLTPKPTKQNKKGPIAGPSPVAVTDKVIVPAYQNPVPENGGTPLLLATGIEPITKQNLIDVTDFNNWLKGMAPVVMEQLLTSLAAASPDIRSRYFYQLFELISKHQVAPTLVNASVVSDNTLILQQLLLNSK